MRWLDIDPVLRPPPAVRIALLRQAIAAAPRHAPLHLQLGEALQQSGDFEAAISSFEAARRLDPDGFDDAYRLAACWLELDRPQLALDACAAARPTARVLYRRGSALRALGRGGEADAAFRAALALGDDSLTALEALLAPLAKREDGAPLLAFCDGLAPRYRATALQRAYRAIALSRLGRTQEAARLVDLDRHVAFAAFTPASGSLEAFNRALAAEILADPPPGQPRRPGRHINYAPQLSRSPTLVALLDFIRGAIVDYLNQPRGLEDILPPVEAATLEIGTVVLRDRGSNGEHIHNLGHVSAVYYVAVPDDVTQSGDERGALSLGGCERVTGGHAACWGKRLIKPVPGRLVLFPSHIFHDVVPSGTAEARISVAADMTPSGLIAAA